MQETQVQFLRQADPLGREYPLQYSCLENSMDKADWRAAVHGVAKSRILTGNAYVFIHVYNRNFDLNVNYE